ncbi:MAG: hypothetical protein Q8R15_01475, partial [Candidatus Micrarchaeota archaeon]|nr:hypothetical protein [Candidatus Micrarchaeota archaeon]
MKQIFAFTVALFFFLSMLSSVASADVGIGVSPSRIVMQVEGGQTQEVQLLFFNTGDDSIQVSVGIDGSIAPFTQVFPAIETVEPEPKPH